MKKILGLVLAVATTLTMVVGCGSETSNQKAQASKAEQATAADKNAGEKRFQGWTSRQSCCVHGAKRKPEQFGYSRF